MKRRDALAGALGLAAMLAVSGCGSSDTFGRSYTPIRYKLTAEVETPQGVKSGYSVIEVQWGMTGSMFGTQGGSSFNVTGEAVAVDVAPGETLFALLRSNTDPDWAAYATENISFAKADDIDRDVFAPEDATVADEVKSGVKDRAAQMAETERYLDQLRSDNSVHPVKKLPYFVRFGDLRDPKSVERVDPDHLDKSFGEGFRLKALTIQITDDPVTVGIEKRLGWLKGGGPLLDAGSIKAPPIGQPYPFAVTINNGDFVKGSKR